MKIDKYVEKLVVSKMVDDVDGSKTIVLKILCYFLDEQMPLILVVSLSKVRGFVAVNVLAGLGCHGKGVAVG
jgi:hypothetical protein